VDSGVLVHQDAWHCADLIVSAERVMECAIRFGIDGKPVPGRQIHVDKIGVGKGATDYMRSKGVIVDAVDFGSEAAGDWPKLTGDLVFRNRKSELLWILRRAIEERVGIIPRRFADTIRQAQWYTYETTPYKGATAIKVAEDKEEIKRRYGRSPDELESLMLAWSRNNPRPMFSTISDLRQIHR
jgi:hypothetical protein